LHCECVGGPVWLLPGWCRCSLFVTPLCTDCDVPGKNGHIISPTSSRSTPSTTTASSLPSRSTGRPARLRAPGMTLPRSRRPLERATRSGQSRLTVSRLRVSPLSHSVRVASRTVPMTVIVARRGMASLAARGGRNSSKNGVSSPSLGRRVGVAWPSETAAHGSLLELRPLLITEVLCDFRFLCSSQEDARLSRWGQVLGTGCGPVESGSYRARQQKRPFAGLL
jgi:hypothetical protein